MVNIENDLMKKCKWKYDAIILNDNDCFVDYDTIIEEYSFCVEKFFTISDLDHGSIVFGDLKIFDKMFDYLDNNHLVESSETL